MSLNEFPGGDPDNIMYGEGMKPIGLTKNRYDVMKPAEYTDAEKAWLADLVKAQGGINAYTERNREYLRSVLGDMLS